MTTRTRQMVSEILASRNELAAELRQASDIREKGGRVDDLWFSDRVQELVRYNRMLMTLGAIPVL